MTRGGETGEQTVHPMLSLKGKDGEWATWIHLPDEDPTSLYANSLVIGVGATREAAMASAARQLDECLLALRAASRVPEPDTTENLTPRAVADRRSEDEVRRRLHRIEQLALLTKLEDYLDNPGESGPGHVLRLYEVIATLRLDLKLAEATGPAPKAEAWQPIATAPKMRKIIVFYTNALGNGRCAMACYYTAHSLEMHDDYAEAGEYDESEGSSYAPEGWYEEHDSDNPMMPLQEAPTHWMPLPSPPDLASRSVATPGPKQCKPLASGEAMTPEPDHDSDDRCHLR